MDRSSDTNTLTGTVTRIGDQYGFLESGDIRNIYFRNEWFSGDPPLRRGEMVTFELRVFDEKPQARRIRRMGEMAAADNAATAAPASLLPRTPRLLEWAYLGYLPEVLVELRNLALEERWEFRNSAADPNRPLPILYSYLVHTFARLVHERKVIVSGDNSHAVFNTGLVDRRYEPIYALFKRQDDPRANWRLSGFCVSGEGALGQSVLRHFKPLPEPAHYFDNPSDLIYDVRHGGPAVGWRHVIVDNIGRWPTEFLEDNRPRGFTLQDVQDVQGMEEDERADFYGRLGEAIEADNRLYRVYMSRLREACDLSLKRISWNFKTAIPTYYPPVKALNLLLPLCIVYDERVDLALVVEKTSAMNYLAHTIFPLDWAYKHARLICRPDSDWLEPDDIEESLVEEE